MAMTKNEYQESIKNLVSNAGIQELNGLRGDVFEIANDIEPHDSVLADKFRRLGEHIQEDTEDIVKYIRFKLDNNIP